MQSFRRVGRALALTTAIAFCSLASIRAARAAARDKSDKTPAPLSAPIQETGFLNRSVTVEGVTYRFQVYLPEDFRRYEPPAKNSKDKKPEQPPPVILYLHGRGERGSEGMWQTQIGLPEQIRNHPDRWPFIVVMPQCPIRHFWTDPDMLQMAMAALDQEVREFHADSDRTYLTGISLGGYGAWELIKLYPHRWAAVALAATGIFWSYAPDRWREVSTLPAEYARRLGRTPVWLFHGTNDTTVVPRQSELMYEAIKAESGHVRLWSYQGLHHDCWSRAFNEPELPRWLLAHRLNAEGQPVHENPKSSETQLPPFAERIVVPLHPPALKLPANILDTYVGEYRDSYNILKATIQRQGDQLFFKNGEGDVLEIQAETSNTFFFPTGSLSRFTFEHDSQGRVTGMLLRDDRHEELWEKRK